MQRFLYVFCYDITNNRCRARVASALEALGVRVQESVFECWLEPGAAARAGRDLRAMMQADDLLTWYRLSREEAHAVRILGRGPAPAEPHGWYA